MSAWPQPLVRTQSVTEQQQTRPRYAPHDFWLPLNVPLIVQRSGETTSLGEVTVPIQTNNETTLVPANAYRATYRLDLQQTAGSGSVQVAVLHRPGGDGPVAAYISAATTLVSVSAPNIDINQGRLTYWTQVTGTATYSLWIYLCSFDRLPA